MELALDTNAYVALQRGDAVLAEYVRAADTVALPVVVLAELRFGFLDGSRLTDNEAVLQRFLATPRVEVLDITAATTRLFGEVATLLKRTGRSIQQNEIWIAALCKQYDVALATRGAGFDHVLGLRVVHFRPASAT